MKVDLEKLGKLATITWEHDLDQTPIRGNAIASGDSDIDKEQEDGIIARVEDGDDWAWCVVTCTATYAGKRGIDSIGTCSYANEADFLRDDYARDLRAMALRSLAHEIESDARHYLGERGQPSRGSTFGKVALAPKRKRGAR